MDKPCFDEADNPAPCFEGNPNAKELCNHLAKGGCWRTCRTGGKSDLLESYQEAMEPETENEQTSHTCPLTNKDCTATCAWWVGGATHGHSGCAVSLIGRWAREERGEK